MGFADGWLKMILIVVWQNQNHFPGIRIRINVSFAPIPDFDSRGIDFDSGLVLIPDVSCETDSSSIRAK